MDLKDPIKSHLAFGAILLATAFVGAIFVVPIGTQLQASTTAKPTRTLPQLHTNARKGVSSPVEMQPSQPTAIELRSPVLAPALVPPRRAQLYAADWNAFWIVAALGSLVFNGIAAALLLVRQRNHSPHRPMHDRQPKGHNYLAMAAAAGEAQDDVEEGLEEVDDYEGEDAEGPMAQLQGELAQVKAKLAEAEKKYMYAVAEIETVRRRGRQQTEDAQKFGVEKFARELLEVADNMARGLAWVPKEVSEGPQGQENPNPDLRSLYGGMRSTERIMLNIFEKQGIQKYEPSGELYDPNLARAIAQVPSPGAEPGTVLEVVNPGYTLNGRVLRAADVVIVQDSG